jgi:hypothetical protein
MTRERGILFSAPMVRAILAGKKTQTRRVVIPQPAAGCRFEMNGAGTHALHLGPPLTADSPAFCCVPVGPKYLDHRLACPYGADGDRLWVRETWQAWRQINVEYDEWEVETDVELMRNATLEYRATSDSLGPWRPSIFLPRWASRITLEITEVRVQRLQDISEDDALAEGCSGHDPDPVDQGGAIYAWKGRSSAPCPRAHFLALWDGINGKRAPWASNPWVWAITFRRLP